MDEFVSTIFKEDPQKTRNLQVSKETTYYVGILIVLIGAVFYILEEAVIAAFVVLAGFLVFIVGKIIMSGRVPSIGHRPTTFKILKDCIMIGQEKISITPTKDLEVTIVSYAGQGVNQRTAFYQTYAGTNNRIKFRFQNKEIEFNFVLDSEYEKDKLVKFCKEHGIRYVDRSGFKTIFG